MKKFEMLCQRKYREEDGKEMFTYDFVEDGVIYQVSTSWFDKDEIYKDDRRKDPDRMTGSEFEELARKFIDWDTQKEVAKKIVEVNGAEYEYDSYNSLYSLKTKNSDNPHVICGRCLNSKFTLIYGNYELFAHCDCGHTMSVYSG